MKHFIKYFTLIFLIACQDLVDIEPSQTETYVRFLGDPGNNFGVTLKETPEGDLLCLGYNVSGDTTRTLLFKTDSFGNIIWVSNSVNSVIGFKGNDLDIGDDGYYIIGDSINNVSGINSIMLLKINTSGVLEKQSIINSIGGISNGKSFSGSAVYAENESEVIGLGYWDNNGNNELFYIQFSFTQSSGYEWVQELNSTFSFSPGRSMVKDVMSQKYVWVASANDGQAFKAARNEIPGQQEPLPVSFAVDIDQTSRNNHFGGIGNDGNGNVVFYDLSQSMTLVDSHLLVAGNALSISALNDGGYAILTTSGGNFTLHKTNSSGNVIGDNISTFSKTIDWVSTESSGAAIGTFDGGFAIFGTSEAGIASMMVLIKTDKNGDL